MAFEFICTILLLIACTVIDDKFMIRNTFFSEHNISSSKLNICPESDGQNSQEYFYANFSTALSGNMQVCQKRSIAENECLTNSNTGYDQIIFDLVHCA